MRRGLTATLAITAIFGLSANAMATDVPLNGKIKLQINTTKQQMQFSAKDPAINFTPGSGSVDDPVTNGASALIFSATDCQCVQLDCLPHTAPGWQPSPTSGTPKKYKFKELVSGSTAQVAEDGVKFKKKGGITYGLDNTPQGQVEVQVMLGNSSDKLCARFAAPTKVKDDSSERYKSGTPVVLGACSSPPGFCPACAPDSCGGSCDCCSSLPSMVAFNGTGQTGGTPTGTLTPKTCQNGSSCNTNGDCVDASVCLGDLEAGTLYSGGGAAGLDPRGVPQSSSYFNVTSCNAGNPDLTPTTSTDTAAVGSVCSTPAGTPTWGERHCTSPNCYVGPPVPVSPTECGVNRVGTSGSVGTGTLTCATGQLDFFLPLLKDTYTSSCPVCSGGSVGSCGSGVCSGGTRNGQTCTPETASGQSLDCPPSGFGSPLTVVHIDDGTVTTGMASASTFSTGTYTNIFCGFCSNSPTTPCTTDAACSPGTCQANSNGAFKRMNATAMQETGAAANTCVATGTHNITAVNVSCVPKTGNNSANSSAGLAGPAAVSVRATVQLIP